jgi:GNAT superfamily N-acetyltransferase
VDYRLATQRDLDLLAEWNYQLIRDEGHRNPMPVSQLRERMEGWLGGEYTAIIFEVGGQPVAHALFAARDDEVYLRQLFVARPHRHVGIGRMAVAILRGEVFPVDKRLTVEVLTANTRAVAFWRAMGFADYSLTLEIMPSE